MMKYFIYILLLLLILNSVWATSQLPERFESQDQINNYIEAGGEVNENFFSGSRLDSIKKLCLEPSACPTLFNAMINTYSTGGSIKGDNIFIINNEEINIGGNVLKLSALDSDNVDIIVNGEDVLFSVNGGEQAILRTSDISQITKISLEDGKLNIQKTDKESMGAIFDDILDDKVGDTVAAEPVEVKKGEEEKQDKINEILNQGVSYKGLMVNANDMEIESKPDKFNLRLDSVQSDTNNPIEVVIEKFENQNLEAGDIIIGYQNSWLDIYLNDRKDISFRVDDNTYTSNIRRVYENLILNNNLNTLSPEIIEQVNIQEQNIAEFYRLFYNLEDYSDLEVINYVNSQRGYEYLKFENNRVVINQDFIGIERPVDVSTNTYSGIRINSVINQYIVNNELAVSNKKRIIVNHNGQLTETSQAIMAESATMFWNIEDTENGRIAHNIVKGAFVAIKDSRDEITKIYLRPDINDNNRAIFQNNEANIYMRAHEDDVIVLSFNPIGNITNIQTNVSEIEGRAIKEIYFGKIHPGNRRQHYVKGSAWELNFIDTPPLISGYKGIYELTQYRSVVNVTIKSKDSLYRYLPQNYEIRHTEYGEAPHITACFIDCPANKKNLIYVREDNIGILSIGQLENAIVDYQGNSREFYDSNTVLMVKESDFDYASSVNSVFGFFININQESELLRRINNEAKRDLSLRESLKQQKELYFQNALPSSFMGFNEKINYQDEKTGLIGQTKIEFYSYIVNNKRKLVLNRFSYNNVMSMYFDNNFAVYLPVNTFVSAENSIRYFVKNDLSISPTLYGVKIFFRSPRDTEIIYGEIIN